MVGNEVHTACAGVAWTHSGLIIHVYCKKIDSCVFQSHCCHSLPYSRQSCDSDTRNCFCFVESGQEQNSRVVSIESIRVMLTRFYIFLSRE